MDSILTYEEFCRLKINKRKQQETQNPDVIASIKNKFKTINAKTLTQLEARAEKHEILFCVNIWTGNTGGVPLYTTFDLDDALNKAINHGYSNPHRSLTRIEYIEIGYHNQYYPKLIGYLGLKDIY